MTTKTTGAKHATIHIGTVVDAKASTDLRAGIKQVLDSAAGDAVKLAAIGALKSQFTGEVSGVSISSSSNFQGC